MQSVHTNSLSRDLGMDGARTKSILANFQDGRPIGIIYPFEVLD